MNDWLAPVRGAVRRRRNLASTLAADGIGDRQTVILRLIGLRFLTAALTLLCVSAIVFAAVEILPGDVAANVLGQFSSETARTALREQLHLDLPALQRYFLWLGDSCRAISALRSAAAAPSPTSYGRASPTLSSSPRAAILLYIPLALFTAIAQALHRNSPLDHVLSGATLVLASIPDFLLALLLLILFVVTLPLLPAVSIVTDLPISLDGCAHWCCLQPRLPSSWRFMQRGCCGTI